MRQVSQTLPLGTYAKCEIMAMLLMLSKSWEKIRK